MVGSDRLAGNGSAGAFVRSGSEGGLPMHNNTGAPGGKRGAQNRSNRLGGAARRPRARATRSAIATAPAAAGAAIRQRRGSDPRGGSRGTIGAGDPTAGRSRADAAGSENSGTYEPG